MRLSHIRTPVLAMLLGAMVACGTSQPTRYYLLSASAAPTPRVSMPNDIRVGVGPIALPSYLDRRELITRSGSNELNVAVYDQWGEPLRENISRVIEEDMARRLGTDGILRLPIKRSLRKTLTVDYQVTIAVATFEKTAGGSVVLNARWGILDNDKKELLRRRSEYREVPAADSYGAQVAAQSIVLGRLTEEIATAILDLYQGSAGQH